MQFATVSGGISNVNAKLTPKPESGLDPVLFKVFGDKTDQIIDRDAETIVVIALGQQGLGPKVCVLSHGTSRWLIACSAHCARPLQRPNI